MKSKTSVFITFIVLVATTGGAYYAWHHHDISKNTAATTSAGKARNTINYSPPTAAEQASGNAQKAQDVQAQATDKPAQTATVIISNASQSGDTIHVRAFVSNAIESDGTCMTTLTNGNDVVTKQTTAFGDASSTQCGAIDFTRDQFAIAGNWNVVVNYSSPKLSGTANTSLIIN